MILTTIAILWVSVAAVFVLGLCMAAAKPVPQSVGWARECADFAAAEEATQSDDAPQTRLYCGRSINLLSGRLSSLESPPDQSPAEKRSGLNGFRQSDDPDRVVSF